MLLINCDASSVWAEAATEAGGVNRRTQQRRMQFNAASDNGSAQSI